MLKQAYRFEKNPSSLYTQSISWISPSILFPPYASCLWACCCFLPISPDICAWMLMWPILRVRTEGSCTGLTDPTLLRPCHLCRTVWSHFLYITQIVALLQHFSLVSFWGGGGVIGHAIQHKQYETHQSGLSYDICGLSWIRQDLPGSISLPEFV